MDTGSKNGYGYHYRFWIDDEIIQRYSCLKIRDDIRFLFEIRTNFRISGGDGDGGDGEIIDTERFEIGARARIDGSLDLRTEDWDLVKWRLTDYWFNYIEIQAFEAEASAFAAAAAAADPRRVIPIAVEMDVRTVRWAEEAAAAAADRAIRSADLFPLRLMYDGNATVHPEKARLKIEAAEKPLSHRDVMVPFLRRLLCPERMERDHYFSFFMDECMICLRAPTVGAEIMLLTDYCGHAFHYACLVRHLIDDDDPSCPLCSHPILPTPEDLNFTKDLYT